MPRTLEEQTEEQRKKPADPQDDGQTKEQESAGHEPDAGEVEEHTSVNLHVVHAAVVSDGDRELCRSNSALAWSGLAAGLSMGFSFIAQGIIYANLPDAPWRPLLVNFGYTFGFLAVIIARQQLFTENTLTAMLPLLTRRDFKTFVQVMRLWVIVLTTNLLGAHVVAWVLGNTPAFSPKVQNAFLELGQHAADVSFGTAVLRGILAGWIIALLVWMLAAVGSHSVAIIVFMTYLVAAGNFTHIIAGSVEYLFLVMTGVKTWPMYLTGYMIPTLIGNVIGGVTLVSALNHAQVVTDESCAMPGGDRERGSGK